MNVDHLRNPKIALRWIVQCLLVFLIMIIFLFSLGKIDNVLNTAIGVTSIGSSAFLAFVAHNSPMAKNQRLLGGYLIAFVVGVSMHWLASRYGYLLFSNPVYAFWFLAALATSISMMIMTLTNLAHAPAAGTSLGIVLVAWTPREMLLVYLAVILIAVIKTVLKPWLINLTDNREAKKLL